MEYRKLGKTNELISVLGYGASPLGNVFDVVDEQEGKNAVHYAIHHGVNFFDVSPFYGITLAETLLGKALLGKRKDIFLATKCGRYDVRSFDFSANFCSSFSFNLSNFLASFSKISFFVINKRPNHIFPYSISDFWVYISLY